MNTAAISLQLRRDHMGVADRGLHASGLEQRRTPRPSGFQASPAQPSGVIVSCGRHASGPERRRTPRPSGFQAALAQPSSVMVSCGRHARGSTNAGLLLRAASTADVARAVRRTPHSSTERFHPALWATRERFDQRRTPRPGGFTPRCGRRASGSTNAGLLLRAVSPPASRRRRNRVTFLNMPVDQRHPLDTIRSTEAGRARDTSGICECGTTAQAVGAASSVPFRRGHALREPGPVHLTPVLGHLGRSATTEAAAQLHGRPLDNGAPCGSSADQASRGTPDVDRGDSYPDTTQPAIAADKHRRCAECHSSTLLALGVCS